MPQDPENNDVSISIELLRNRSAIIQQIRQFFLNRDFWEVDCPIACKQRIFEPNIDLVSVTINGESGWLHSSPEPGMKQLLAEGSGNIFQISHVFRDNEQGKHHSPEFSLLEWYSTNSSLDNTIQYSIELIQEILGPIPSVITTYAQLFQEQIGIDPHVAPLSLLIKKISSKKDLYPYQGLLQQNRDELLNFLMASVIEPSLSNDAITVIQDFPASQTPMGIWKKEKGRMIGKRFEIYKGSLELANGAQEEINAPQQIKRLKNLHEQHAQKNSSSAILNQGLLTALQKGLPNCCGVALGLERLCMLSCNISSIEEFLPLNWR